MAETIHQYRLSAYRKYDPKFFESDHVKEMIRNGTLFVVTAEESTGVGVPFDKVAGKVVAISVDDAGVNVSFIFLDTPMGNMAQHMPKHLLKVVPIGTGTLNNDVVQDDYRLSYFSLCLKQGDEDVEQGRTSEEEPQSGETPPPHDAGEGEGPPSS